MGSSIGLSGTQKLISILLGGLATYFCISAYSAALWLKPSSQSVKLEINQKNNLFLGSDFFYARGLSDQLVEALKPLEFMVWPEERRQISSEAAHLLHQGINRQPFDYYLWRQLSYAQADSGAALSERTWSLQVALNLVRWNDNERSFLTHHCLHTGAGFRGDAPQLCGELIYRLPNLPIHKLSRNTGIPQDSLKKVLLEKEVLKMRNGSNQ